MGDAMTPLPIWLIPALPAAGFVVLALFGGQLSRRLVAIVGAGSVGLSAATTLVVASSFLRHPPSTGVWIEKLWTWIDIGPFEIGFNLALDGLSLVMIFVVTFVEIGRAHV